MDQMKVGNNNDYFICSASILGNSNRVWGHRNAITGNGNEVYGNCNTVIGDNNTVKGLNNRVLGENNNVVDMVRGGSGSEATFPTAEVSVNICNRTRVRTDSQGRRSCENFHVELVEHKQQQQQQQAPPQTSSGPRQNCSSCPSTPRHYDLSSLDGADSETLSGQAGTSGLQPCSVCLSRERCVKFSPCRHVPACLECTRRMFTGARTRSVLCPLCRSPVEEVERLFLG